MDDLRIERAEISGSAVTERRSNGRDERRFDAVTREVATMAAVLSRRT